MGSHFAMPSQQSLGVAQELISPEFTRNSDLHILCGQLSYLFLDMAELKIEFSNEDYTLLENGQIGIADFLNKVLPIGSEDILNPDNDLINLLLSYHSDDGGAVTVTKAELGRVVYDLSKKTGKITFKYHLAYHYACSYSEKDYEKNDKVDFSIDPMGNTVVLTFLDVNTRSTAEEF